MLNAEQKKEVINQIAKDVYGDYVRNKLMFDFLKENHFEEIEKGTGDLRIKLAETTKKYKELSADKSIADEDKKDALLKMGSEISKLNGEIDYIEDLAKDYKTAKQNVNEVTKQYGLLIKYGESLDEPKEM